MNDYKEHSYYGRMDISCNGKNLADWLVDEHENKLNQPKEKQSSQIVRKGKKVYRVRRGAIERQKKYAPRNRREKEEIS